MIRSAIIILLVNYCASLFSQASILSRKYEAFKKNVPLAIINTHPNYFHLLRYNKEAHDFTLERRDKPSAEMIRFNPLKLDIINADWFNYENLDYLLFENNHRICFVFEKVLNSKREIYLKVIDTNGVSTDFIQLAVMDKDKGVEDFHFKFSITNEKKILIVGTENYVTGITRKVALLYDPEKMEKLWVKKLPQENAETGNSVSFECNAHGDLFYAYLRPRVASFKRKYIDHKQQEVPVYAYDVKELVCFLKEDGHPRKTQLSIQNTYQVYGLCLFPDTTGVAMALHYTTISENGEEKIFFLTEKWNKSMTSMHYKTTTQLDSLIEKQLTYYDGTDFSSASDKDFKILNQFTDNTNGYFVSEHREENFFKELLFVKIDLQNGEILDQNLIPRKVIFYKGRYRYKNISESIHLWCDGNYQSIFMENAKNSSKAPSDYRYRKFAKAGSLKGTNIVSYISKPDGALEKKIVFENGDYEYIPIPEKSNACDLVFYLTNGTFERFVILKPYP